MQVVRANIFEIDKIVFCVNCKYIVTLKKNEANTNENKIIKQLQMWMDICI